MEQLCDLQVNGCRLWQSDDHCRFGTDGVLLSKFAACTPKMRVMDLCSGTGIVPFLLLARGEAEKAEALELQPALCALMEKSRKENHFEERLTVIEGDLCRIETLAQGNVYDLVTVNPPYEAAGAGIQSPNPRRELARREIACTIKDVVRAANYLLKPGGRLAVVYRPGRLADLFAAMAAYKITPARLQMVTPRRGAAPVLTLVEGVFARTPQLKVGPEIILSEEAE